ncbi:unnamed protein product, partial [Mesorhabditis belari]|uniref:Uncharacterized protein n=1 Tax=Mesorhabditis belari TaxID=2138241 RepID=A0AAF3FKF0_9BILA
MGSLNNMSRRTLELPFKSMPCENVAPHFPEIKRAQMIKHYWLTKTSEMSDVENRVVMVAVVKIAGKVECGPEYENGMCERLKSGVCNDKLQCQEDKVNQWESQLLKFFDFAISRKHLLHFLRISY